MSDFKTALFIGSLAGMVAAPFILLIAWLPLRRKAEGDEVSHEERMAVLRNTIIAVVLVIVGTTGAYLVFNEKGALPTEASGGAMGGGTAGGGAMGGGAVPQLPDRVAGLAQAQLTTGDGAAQAVATMNPGGQFPYSAAEMATYGGGEQQVTVRVAALPAPAMATQNVDTLVGMFSSGQMVVGKPKEVQPGLYEAASPAGPNYFFAAGPNVVWIQVSDAKLADRALEEIRSATGA